MIRKIEKPWGNEKIWAETDKYVGKILFIKKGQRLSLQYHEIKEETIYVLKGELTLIFGDDKDDLSSIILKEESSYHIPPGKIHRFCANDSDVLIVEVSTTELDDVIRIQDDYKRN